MRTLAAALLLSTTLTAAAQDPSPFEPVRFLVGSWDGTASGQAGDGTVKRSYEWAMNGRFIHERNVSTYAAQAKNPKDEVHEHWSMISYDRARKALVLRQFHVEGFVNQYALDAASSTATRLVFESENFENFSNRWRARETYEVLGPDEFTETFELAAPDKPLEVYSTNRFRRSAAASR